MKDKDDVSNNNANSVINIICINRPIPSESRIGYNHPFCYCKEHLI
jgi:hypothetical protein